jgi:hypothetical protein
MIVMMIWQTRMMLNQGNLLQGTFKAFCQSMVPPVTHVTKKGLISCSRTKRMTLEAVGPSSFASRKKKPKKDQ